MFYMASSLISDSHRLIHSFFSHVVVFHAYPLWLNPTWALKDLIRPLTQVPSLRGHMWRTVALRTSSFTSKPVAGLDLGAEHSQLGAFRGVRGGWILVVAMILSPLSCPDPPQRIFRPQQNCWRRLEDIH